MCFICIGVPVLMVLNNKTMIQEVGGYLYIFISHHVSPDGETWGNCCCEGTPSGTPHLHRLVFRQTRQTPQASFYYWWITEDRVGISFGFEDLLLIIKNTKVQAQIVDP